MNYIEYKFKRGEFVVFKNNFTDRIYKVINFVEDNPDIIVECQTYGNRSRWRQDAFEKITKEKYPEYYL